MSDVTNALTVMSSTECYELLRTRHVGRLGVVSRGFPIIVPVNYAMDQDVVVFRSRPGSKLSAIEGNNVAFEVDQILEDSHTGWSVLIRGTAERVDLTEPSGAVARTLATAISPWAPGMNMPWVRLTPLSITGRRIVQGEPRPWWLDSAYSFG